MGPPGAGKSTLARQLGARFGIPVYHLDQVWWRPGWIEAPPDAFRADVERIAALPAWVIDGNFTATIAPRLRAADTLIYLDCPNWLSVLRVIRRTISGYGRIRPDMPAGCLERFELEFLRFVWAYNRYAAGTESGADRKASPAGRSFLPAGGMRSASWTHAGR